MIVVVATVASAESPFSDISMPNKTINWHFLRSEKSTN